MNRKLGLLIVLLGIISGITFTGFGVWHSSRTTPVFDTSGYVLCGDEDEGKWISFNSGAEYGSTLSGTINFSSTDNGKTFVPKESFVRFDDDSIMALSDGILLDFKDMSDNFINNYYLNGGLRISDAGNTYMADTSTGTTEFGEYLWKLSNKKYIIVSPELKVHMSDDDIRDVNDYVQVTVTDDNVVHLLTPENLWMTISDECYIETAGGVQIYPVSQLIDNGTYKMSLAKLSVNMDDAILLTKDETRRQIVPELKIEGVDGEDGADGQDGQTGRDGEEGTAGAEGAEGTKGDNGQNGSDGSRGSNGSSGASGARGSNGSNGGNGKDGKSADIETTTKNTLPTMTISDWQISSTKLCGTLKITDKSELLTAIESLGGVQKFPGAVTITDTSTGEVIHCYQTNANYADSDGGDTAFDFYSGDAEVYFTTGNTAGTNALKPDTEYKLSVTAHYKMNDSTDTVFSREFVGRIFYTDSTGIVLSYESATENKLTIRATVQDSYADSISKATVYLLTPEQNESFTVASINDTTAYTASAVIGSSSSSEAIKFEGGKADVAFEGLEPNKHYIARVYVESTSGLNSLTNQALDVLTLKRTPTKKEADGKPEVYYNRATGAFEVFRPTVVDQDGGVESYTYTAYYYDNGQWVKESDRSITASTGEPVEFRLTEGRTYQFGVEATFNDNEKTVFIDLGRSDNITATGDTMPKVTLSSTKKDYNKLTGTIHISLGANSSIDTNQPIELEFFADQIPSESVKVTGATPSSQPGRHTVAASNISKNGNVCDIAIDLENLKKNTNYSITVSGSLNLGDGNDGIQRAIGTVSFNTYDVLTLSANWDSPGAGSHAFLRTLRLNVEDSMSTDERESYALSELKNGQVTVELFSGTGAGKLRIAQKNFNQTEDLEKLFGDTGLEITENDFGSPNLSSEGNYTLTVTEVVDQSYAMDLGYINDFDKLLNPSSVVTAEPTPPDLLTDPSKGINANPIYNVDAVKYGGKVDESLPDDAIVGYTLESTYDNVQRIGKNITYYAYEYNAFFNALNSGDPLKRATPLMKMTQPIDQSKDTTPKIALFFGGSSATTDEEAQYTDGYMRYYAGEPNLLGSSLSSGMGRGYRYIFAYTVEYSSGSESEGGAGRTYPYDHKDYDSFNRYYGGVKENNVQVGQNVAYILNSGMCEAPYIMPDFHTYVYRSAPDELSASGTTASGTVTLHYSWRDPDKLIVTGLGDDKNTKISYKIGNNTDSKVINDDSYDGNWYQIVMKYAVSSKKGDELLTPTVNISEYNLDYTTVLSKFWLPVDEKEYPLAKIPLDWSWEKEFTGSKNSSILPLIQIDMTHLNDNYIAFNLVANGTNTALLESVASRAVAMRLTIKTGSEEADTFTLPITTDVAGTYYAKMVTGDLGQKYLGKSFTLTKAELLYDSGTQGWNVAETDDEYTIQYINEKNIADSFAFSRYVGASNNNHIFANGALLQGRMTLSDLRKTVGSTEENDSKYTLSLKRPIGGTYLVYYNYPDHMGVDMDNSNMAGKYSGEYAVPKHISTLKLNIQGDDTKTLTKITPTMQNEPYIISASSGFTVTNLKVSGLKEAAAGEPDPQIWMAVYENAEDANRLSGDYKGSPIPISIGSDGTPSNHYPDSETINGRFTVSGLDAQKTYYVAFYYNTDGQNVLLLKSGGAKVAIYPVTTSGDVNFNIVEIKYKNEDYFHKEINAKFTMNRTYGVTVRYDLYADEASANSATATPILSYEQLKGDGVPENSILFESALSSTSENEVKIDLTPSIKRKAIKPGFTYCLKITAQEDYNGTLNPVGSVAREFTIPAVGNYGALIYVKNATKDSITYQVTINDVQHSFMERNKGAVSEGALYAVRFTDGDGHWIRTIYDDKVYSATDLRRIFVLNDAALKNASYGYHDDPDDQLATNNTRMVANKTYKLNVYAVPDADHDGTISIDGADKTWSDFFDKAKSKLEECGEKFLNILNTFWTGLDPNPASSDTEKALMVASKSQSTTTESGWLLNDQQVFASRYNTNTIRVVLQESVGLIYSDSTPVFQKIEWSVDGFKSDGTPLSASGIQLHSKGHKLLVPDTIGGVGDNGYDVYYFEIPYDIDQGNYTIVMKLYEHEDDVAASKTISVRSAA